MKPPEEFNDVIELGKWYHIFRIVLDEDLLALRTPLEDQGFRVWRPCRREEIKDEARGFAILTRNSEAFIYDAVLLDYDVISVEDLKLIEEGAERIKEQVGKISAAVRRSRLRSRRGNVLLKVRDDGSFHLEGLS
jgi:hypothetical protein